MNHKYLIPRREKYIFSGICLFLIFIRIFSPQAISWISIALLGLALTPWIIHIIKGVELPGGAKFEFGYSQQTTGEIPLSLPKSPQSHLNDENLLSDQSIVRTLKTLWKYQKEYYSNDPIKRWAFKVTPPAPEFGEYLDSVTKLYKYGYVTFSQTENHCMLTNEGVSFCKKNDEKLKVENTSEIYRF